MRPLANREAAMPASGLMLPEAEPRQIRHVESADARDIADGVARRIGSPYCAASGMAPMPTLSSTIQITRRNISSSVTCG